MLDALMKSFQLLKIRLSVRLKSRKRRRQLASSGGAAALLYGLCRKFSLAEIKAATNNFCEDLMLGIRGFGCVYKGFMDNDTSVVAVRRLSESSLQAVHEFKTEVLMLCQLHHPNLVVLTGFCYEENEVIVVYEYMNNLTLEHHIYGPSEHGRDPLSWEQRLKICISVAHALHYLHAGAKYAIIHRHVKSSSILLDENWTVKLSSFGLSKLGPLSMSKSLIRMDSEVMGTWGYADPEYVATGALTEKSDVYSFGVVLVEVLCGRKVIDQSRDRDQMHLIEWARKCIENGSIYSIIDPYLEGRIAPQSFQKFVEIAYDCTREDGRERPSMGEVEVSLELALELQEKAQLHSSFREQGRI